MSAPIKVIIADDSPVFREGLISNFARYHTISIVGEARNGSELLELLKKNDCDVVLLDIKMPLMNGIEATTQIKQKFPNIKVIVLSVNQEESYIVKLIKCGASTYLFKDATSMEGIVKAITSVKKTGGYYEPYVEKALNAHQENKEHASKIVDTGKGISQQEIKALKLRMEDKSDKEIADVLSVSKHTVKCYWKEWIKKTGKKSLMQAMLYAIKHHLLDEG